MRYPAEAGTTSLLAEHLFEGLFWQTIYEWEIKVLCAGGLSGLRRGGFFDKMVRMCEEWMISRLEAARAAGMERSARVVPEAGGKFKLEGREVLNFSSNDYLDLGRHRHVMDCSREALDQYGIGSASSRLVTGTLPIHETLEARLAKEKGFEAALVFGSGYMANAGTIPVLAGREDVILADKLVHASMIDACRLSGAKLVRFAHNDVEALERRLEQVGDFAGRKLILTESVFSMDGDLAPLKEIAALARKHDAMLMVDEAHACGTFGPNGSGLIREHELESDVTVSMGTMSKAMAGYGGYVACSENLRKLLVHESRAFIFTTAPPPAVMGAALGVLDVFEASPRLGAILQANADYFRMLLNDAGLDTLQSRSQIIPIVIGENEKAVAVSMKLREQGIIASAIRPPTVPEGTARLRLSVTLAHLVDDLEHAAKVIAETIRQCGC